MTCKECIHKAVCYRVDSVKSDYARKCGDFVSGCKGLEQEPCDDAISREAVLKKQYRIDDSATLSTRDVVNVEDIEDLPPVTPQPKTGQYEKHIDHTDCIWYGSDSGCPVTCSQYRDGWNDAMDCIFKNGKGYQPYRHDS